jgi:predicted nucleic acid-binding protein
VRLVVGASAIAEVLASRDRGERVARTVLGHDLFAPQLLIPEVVSTLRGWVLGRRLDPDRAAGALDDFRALDITLVDMFPLVGDVWRLRDGITAYDAMYVALARAMACPLVTLDRKLVAALPADVQVLAADC